MINRSNLVFGLLVLLAVVSAIGFGLMVTQLGRDSCMDGGASGGSCPVLAEVGSVRYGVGAASDYIGLEQDLAPYSPITRTNAPDRFAELVTFRVADFDPTSVLAAPSRHVSDEDVGPYRLLFGPNADRAWPALCSYFPIELRQVDDRCSVPV